ncbi:MAG: PTS ascorbate transporter subunit IIB [Pelolinea sp.]|jgi:PTS system ascorbate-specific IIB component|nr:PTS ascorbate transporter subunit IIB [Pelolinea sp.]
MKTRTIKFLAVCGNGLGSSLIVKMILEGVLADLNVRGIVESTSVSQAAGMIPFADVIITSTAFFKGIESVLPKEKPVITCQNILDKEELTKRVQELIKEKFSD